MRSPNEIGEDLEVRVLDVFAGADSQRVKQSGGGKFWKLDVVIRKLLFVVSCKATAKGKRSATPSVRITKDLILEARRGARGFTGTGDGYDWAIVAEVEGIAVFVCELDVAAQKLTAPPGEGGNITPSKAAERLSRTRRSLSG